MAAAVQRARDAGGEHDLLGGLAGMAIGLLAIHERTRNPQIREAARAAVARLIEAGRRDAFGMSWPDPQNSTAPALCGLGHGVSGMAWALAEAGWAAGTEAFEPFVHDALRYERGWFSPDHCAWADLREPPGGGSSESFPAWTSAWCHGAFGIGAVRWRVYEKTGDLTALAEATSAIEAARSFVERAGRLLRDGQVSDVTLCHGLGGAIEVMLLGYEVTGERDHLIAARRVGDICLSIHAANAHRWTVGLKNAELVPGLFTGLAGTGVTMLRLHDLGSIASPMLPGRARWTPRLQDVQPIASAST
ncbi:MAG: hypothetical protein H0V80_10220 [Acidobacteria bacterium]|nr:hypothetical protein [Acidobacteriota bacterium]